MKILIADDNHSVRRALQVMLEALGHEITGVAVDGNEAIEMYERVRPDIAFLDVRMPNKHGLESLQQIVGSHKDACVIIYTGGESCEREAYASGAIGYLEKPFGLDSLAQQIAKVIVRRSGTVAPGPN
jgi:two-component system chemotaxis response regulator CheY